MSKLLILYNYNKYYNRIVKKLATFADYQALTTSTPPQYRGLIRENMNFDYQDGVHARHVINISNNDPGFAKVESPDYCVLEESYKEGNTTVTKLSRWFILESVRIRGNQYELSMRRDLLADYYENVLTAPVFIEKGWLVDSNDSAIFNYENMTFNQIKKHELKLDFTPYSGNKGGWIVGYIAKEETPTDLGPASGQAELPTGIPDFDDLPERLQNSLNSGIGIYYDNEKYYLVFNSCLASGTNITSDPHVFVVEDIYDTQPAVYVTGAKWNIKLNGHPPYNESTSYPKLFFDYFNNDIANMADYIQTQYQSSYNSLQLLNVFNDLYAVERPNAFDFDFSSYNGTYYRDAGTGKYYKIKIEPRETSSIYDRMYIKKYTLSQLKAGTDACSRLANTFISQYLINGRSVIENPDANQSKIVVGFGRDEVVYDVTAEEVGFAEVTATIPAGRNKLLDAPYDMFCIPLGIVSVRQALVNIFDTTLYSALAISRAIALKGTSSRIYDIQVLPYCPFREAIDSQGRIDITSLTVNKDYSFVKNSISDENVNIILYPKRSKGTFDLEIPNDTIYESNCVSINNSLNKKVASQTKIVRFVSPNFASMFEMNVQKNNGIRLLNVDYFYKPYSPYLHVAPYFSGLYGEDFNDPKGLICSGDFSMATASSKWEEFQIQNKNYQEQFNRQIENLDINNSIAYSYAEEAGNISKWATGIQGAITGMAAGALAGSAATPVGAIIGAVAGGVAGGVSSGIVSKQGLKVDLKYMTQSQQEARSYAVDMYSYNLGNIRALPHTLTKVSAFTENNKIFPFIEFYDCTDEERTALTNKLLYNGMTVGRIGHIEDYIYGGYHYVQGQLIRLEGIDEENHVIAEIANEIKQGAYYYGYDTSES